MSEAGAGLFYPDSPADDEGPLLDVWAKLGVRIESLTSELRAQREERARLWAEIRFVPLNPVQAPFASLPALMAVTPKHGFTWAVQRVTVAGIGASPDTVSVYRGASLSDVVPQNLLNVLTAASPTWHPGGKGLLLKPSQTLIIAGGTTGNTYTLSADVIQVSDDQLPYYLL